MLARRLVEAGCRFVTVNTNDWDTHGQNFKLLKEKLVPPVPEERPSGDPTGAVLGFALADTILRAHQGSVEEKDKALFVVLPARS